MSGTSVFFASNLLKILNKHEINVYEFCSGFFIFDFEKVLVYINTKEGLGLRLLSQLCTDFQLDLICSYFFVQIVQELYNHVKELEEKYKDMQKLQDLKLSVVSLKKELAWAFVAEKKQVENIYEMIKI